MVEPLRRDNPLTTADLAGRREETQPVPSEPLDIEERNRPRLVRNENALDRMEPNSATDAPAQPAQNVTSPAPLFSQSDIGDLRGRWSNVQASFVDEPRHAVEEADKLVAAVMQRLAEGFATERSNLEKQWDSGDNVSTENLRIALQRYRSFFDRLLNV
jgi:hypothetical protein